MKVYATVCCLLTSLVMAQVPTITSFSPTSGPVGTTVTIAGTNFNTTAGQNIVCFGAVRANVGFSTSTSLSVTTPAGSTFVPISVLDSVSGLAAYSSQPFVVTFPTSATITSGSFTGKVDFATGTSPYGVAIGDLDGDGKPDLLVINYGSNAVSVFRNTSTSGSITSGSFATKVDFTTGTNPFAVATGDVDGDGKLDVVVANSNSNTISVFRNTSSPGSVSFAAKVDFTTGNSPASVAIGDVDADGKPDIIVANYGSSTVSVLKNTSSPGSITTSSLAAKVDFPTGTLPYGVAFGDIDGDGKPDLVIANFTNTSSNGTVSVLRNTSASGSITSGSFITKVDYAVGVSPECVAIGDVDGDGKPDLVVANYHSSSISVLRNTSSPGSIGSSSFAANVDFTTGSGTVGVAISDIDGDGKQDLVVATGSSVSVLKNTSSSGSIGTGSFASRVDFLAGNTPQCIAVGDLDGDGKMDVVVANEAGNTVSVLRNTVAPPLAAPTIASFSPARNSLNVPTSTTIAVTFDTDIDTATIASTSIRIIGSLSGTHLFNKVYSSSTMTVTLFPIIPFRVGETIAVTATRSLRDVTGDSLAVSVEWSFVIRTDIATGTFEQTSNPAVGTGPIIVASGDWNGDGHLDLAVTNYGSNTISILFNNGRGYFAPGSTLVVGNSPYAIVAGDWNGDGYQDLAVTIVSSGTVAILLNDGSGQFTQTSTIVVGSLPGSLVAGDWNGDGYLDLALTNAGSNTVSILLNNGTGLFTLASTVSGFDYPYLMVSGDWNGDGYLDLALTNYASSTVSTLLNDGNGQFTRSSTVAVGDGPCSVIAGDWNHDGNLDLATANYNGTANTVSVLFNDDAGRFTLASTVPVGTSPWSLASGDWNGDGYLDLAVTNYHSDTVSILLNNGTGQFTVSSSVTVGNNPRQVIMGDWNEDGRPDLVVLNETNNSVSVLQNIVIDSLANRFTSGWSLMGMPLKSNDTALAGNLIDDINGPYYVYDYSPTNGYTRPAALTQGHGYWLGLLSNQTVDVIGRAISDSMVVPLTQGFNLVSNPMVVAVPKTDLFFSLGGMELPYATAIDTGWIGAGLTGFSSLSQSYQLSDTLQIWSGYWLGVLDSGVTMIVRPPVGSLMLVLPSVRPSKTKSTTDWQIGIIAQVGTIQDQPLTFGVKSDAVAGFNVKYDIPKSPTPPVAHYVETCFSEPTWAPVLGSKFVSNFLSPSVPLQWTFFVTPSDSGTVTLRWNPQDVPVNVVLILTDKISGNSILMHSVSSYTFSAQTKRQFTITGVVNSVGLKDGIPTSYSLSQNYPNPFNPSTTIQFALPKLARVSLYVCDILGRRVLTLIDHNEYQAGFQQKVWDGRNSGREPISSGVYFYNLEVVPVDGSTPFIQTKKMIFLK